MRLAAPLLLALLACLPPATARAGFSAAARDPAGDATAPEPGRDLLAAGIGYDRRSGLVAGAVALRGEPVGAGSFLHIQLGRMTDGRCEGPPVIGLGSFTDEFGASWLRFAAPGQVTARGDVDKRGGGQTVQTFEATSRALRGIRPDCALALLADPSDSTVVYDVVGPFALLPRPGLAVRVGGLPDDLRRGRSYRLSVTVSNPGEARTGPVTVRLRRARGFAGSPRSVRLRAVRPGGRATARFTIRPGSRAGYATDLVVTARAGRLAASAERKVHVTTPDRPSRRGGGGGSGGGGACIQYFPDLSGDTGGSLGLVPC